MRDGRIWQASKRADLASRKRRIWLNHRPCGCPASMTLFTRCIQHFKDPMPKTGMAVLLTVKARTHDVLKLCSNCTKQALCVTVPRCNTRRCAKEVRMIPDLKTASLQDVCGAISLLHQFIHETSDRVNESINPSHQSGKPDKLAVKNIKFASPGEHGVRGWKSDGLQATTKLSLLALIKDSCAQGTMVIMNWPNVQVQEIAMVWISTAAVLEI